jgi:aldehyde:ferredoxin oxidoreductase
MYSAVTGLDAGKFDEYSKNIVNLQRAILMREGRKFTQADYPKEYLFTEPIVEDHPVMVPGPTGPIDVTGNKLDKQKHESMLQEFYKLRDWDPKTGMPNDKIPEVKR